MNIPDIKKNFFKFTIGIFLCVVGFAGSSSFLYASEGDKSVEMLIGVGGDSNLPKLETDERAFGFDFRARRSGGIGYSKEMNNNIHYRVDILRFSWKENNTAVVSGTSVTRIEKLQNSSLTLAGRYYPLSTGPYCELGISLNFLEYNYSDTISGVLRTGNKSKIKGSIVAGLGFTTYIYKNISIGANVRYRRISQWNNIDPTFYSMLAVISYHEKVTPKPAEDKKNTQPK